MAVPKGLWHLQVMHRQRLLELSAISLAILIDFLVFQMIDAPPPTRGEVADWVQGLGSIAAVAIAAWVGTLPIRHEARRKRTESIAHLAAIIAAAEHLRVRTDKLYAKAVERDPVGLEAMAWVIGATSPDEPLRELLSSNSQYGEYIDLRIKVHDMISSYQAFLGLTRRTIDLRHEWDAEHWNVVITSYVSFEECHGRLTASATGAAKHLKAHSMH